MIQFKTYLLGFWLVVAMCGCQAAGEVQEVTREVEVTRLVEITPGGADLPDAPDSNPVVVTRVVVEVEERTVEEVGEPLGSAARPIQIWSAPSVGADIGDTRLTIVSETLTEVTGQTVEVHLADSDAAVVEALCDNPASTVAIVPATVYATANRECEAQPGLAAVRFEQPWHAGMILVRQDSGITSLADLAGLRWGVADRQSIAMFGYFESLLADAGIEVGEIVELGNETEVMLALMAGEVDFVTATFTPPILPFEERTWQYGEDDPEIWRGFGGFQPERHPIGFIVVAGLPENGGYRIRDARALAFDVEPEIFNATRILQLSAPIPNDSIIFGANFPLGLARDLMQQLRDFAAGEGCAQTLCSRDFYDWHGLTPVEDAFYEPVR